MKRKTVLITGAAKGIGRAIAICFARQGYQVCINYHTSQKEAKALESMLQEAGYSVMIYSADVSDRKQVKQMVTTVMEKWGSIDVLVNNSGIAQYKLFTDITEEDMRQMIEVSLLGCFHMSQEVIGQSMLPRKDGVIINISSMWGITGASCEVHYSMVKSGIIGMTKALAKEMGLSHIRVNAVAPGVIQTDMMKGFNEQELATIKEEIPLNRFGTPEDVAGVVTFLASEEASYITGQVISPNGGMVI